MNFLPESGRSPGLDVGQVSRVVCIMSYTSSASCLMSSLLDNHPNVLSTPDNVMGDFQAFWERNASLSLDPLITEFMDEYAMFFDARMKRKGYEGTVETGETLGFTKLGPNRDECLEVDRDAFRRSVHESVDDAHSVPKKLFFQALHVAYGEALRREIADPPVIVFGLHSLIYEGRLQGLLEDFSDVYFLQMVRNPILATASRVRRQIRLDWGVSWGFAKAMIGVCRGGVTSPLVPDSRWRAVRMEDLHSAPEETMRKVCDWLDLPWDDTLLKSTINGKQWWNEKRSTRVSGFSPAIASQSFDEYLTGFDRFRLGVLLGRKCASWDYPVSRWCRNPIVRVMILPLLMIPFKMELLVRPSVRACVQGGTGSLGRRVQRCLRSLAVWFVKGRLEVARAWFLVVSGRDHEVELL